MELVRRDTLLQTIKLNKEIIRVIEQAFNDLVSKTVNMPPIMRVDVPEHNGEVDIKSAYVVGYDSFAIKVSSGFFNNYQLGLPSANGLMLLMGAETGVPLAILEDNGYLTEIRTAAAGAIAADYLANKKCPVVGIVGTGAQARLQLQALSLVRKVEEVHVYGRHYKNAEKFKKDIEKNLQLPVTVQTDPKPVVELSDTVVTTTPTSEPIIQADWLHPGLHITAMGSDAEHKKELADGVLESADLVVCDKREQSTRLGELKNQKHIEKEAIELGQITSGTRMGRTLTQQITICDLTGTGIQDTAIARYAYQRIKNHH